MVLCRFFFLFLYLLLWSTESLGQRSMCQEASNLINKINSLHIEAVGAGSDVPADFSIRFIQEVDEDRFLFTQLDVDQLARIEPKNVQGRCDLFTKTSNLITQRLKQFSYHIDSLLKKPVERNLRVGSPVNDSFTTFCKTEFDLKKRWTDMISIDVYDRMTKLRQNRLDLRKDSNALEQEARKQIMSREMRELAKLLGEDATPSLILKAIARAYDPHTEYFEPIEAADFHGSLDNKEASFGLIFKDNLLEQVTVELIIPGTSAWHSNEIHQNDQLLEVYTEKDTLYAYDYDALEINEILASSELDEVELKLLKLNGNIIDVALRKTEIQHTTNNVTGFVLEGSIRVGYISLPAFYTNFESEYQLGCANDVAKEIVKLKKENIQGLILDLRYNGGGSMMEAIELAGIFIDFGTVALMEDRSGVLSLKDSNKGSVYDGPLLVLINRASASASELVAAILQDYQRAIIVGSPTFGKATGQIVSAIKEGDLNSGVVKVSTEKIYRLNGQSYQAQGVVPDIPLSDITDVVVPGEAGYQNPIRSGTISKKVYYAPLPGLPIDQLRQQSASRTNQSELFETIREFKNWLSVVDIKSYDEYSDFYSRIQEFTETISNNSDPVGYTVKSNRFEESVSQISDYQNGIDQKTKSSIQNSLYINEAYQILIDYLKIR